MYVEAIIRLERLERIERVIDARAAQADNDGFKEYIRALKI